ncbi:MAG: hypothetical protein ACREJ2_09135, partial [Planctomycetota bacterium]
ETLEDSLDTGWSARATSESELANFRFGNEWSVKIHFVAAIILKLKISKASYCLFRHDLSELI